MNNQEVLNDILKKILIDYFNTFNILPFEVNISIVDDMCRAYADIRPDHIEKHPQQFTSQNLNNYNGMTVPPKDINGTFTILLNSKFLLEYIQSGNATWVGTIVHETTHIIDFIEFANLTKVTSYDEITDMSKNLMFQLWTEFNAKAKGYYFVRKYTFLDLHEEEKQQIHDIVNSELPSQMQLMYDNYHSTNDGFQQAYCVSHYLGRLFTLQQIFPDYFDDDFIQENIGINDWMYQWFIFLSTHTELKNAYANFDEMNNILKQNFQGL